MRTVAVKSVGCIAIPTEDAVPGRISFVAQPIAEAACPTTSFKALAMFCSAALYVIERQELNVRLTATRAFRWVSSVVFESFYLDLELGCFNPRLHQFSVSVPEGCLPFVDARDASGGKPIFGFAVSMKACFSTANKTAATILRAFSWFRSLAVVLVISLLIEALHRLAALLAVLGEAVLPSGAWVEERVTKESFAFEATLERFAGECYCFFSHRRSLRLIGGQAPRTVPAVRGSAYYTMKAA